MPQADRHDEFMQLYVPCQSRIYGYIRSLVLDRSDAEELLQEVASVLWRRFGEFEQGTHFDRWAYRIAYHQVLYHRRRQRTAARQLSEPVLELISARAANDVPEMAEYHDALQECLAKLPEEDRQVLRRRFDEGATNRSLAATTGQSEWAIGRKLNKIYSTLLACIRGKEAGTQP